MYTSEWLISSILYFYRMKCNRFSLKFSLDVHHGCGGPAEYRVVGKRREKSRACKRRASTPIALRTNRNDTYFWHYRHTLRMDRTEVG